jgi:hypothetical protein
MTPQTNLPTPLTTSLPPTSPAKVGTRTDPALERRGRAWLLWSFLLCPCHLPLTLAALTAVLAGTSLGVTLRDHVWLAGAIVTTAWLAGTGYGLRLIRQAEKANGTCPVRAGSRR